MWAIFENLLFYCFPFSSNNLRNLLFYNSIKRYEIFNLLLCGNRFRGKISYKSDN